MHSTRSKRPAEHWYLLIEDNWSNSRRFYSFSELSQRLRNEFGLFEDNFCAWNRPSVSFSLCKKQKQTSLGLSSLKIYAIRLNTKSVISLSSKGPKRLDDWLEINNNGEKITSLARQSYSLLYDDVIDVNLKFKTESITSKQDVIGFLLYFIGRIRVLLLKINLLSVF